MAQNLQYFLMTSSAIQEVSYFSNLTEQIEDQKKLSIDGNIIIHGVHENENKKLSIS